MPLRPLLLAVMAFSMALTANVGFTAAGTFYQVEVELDGQAVASRQAASREGLEIVLMRVSGLQSLPSVPAIEEAFAQPERFFNSYFFTDDQRLRFLFAEDAILGLINQAKLPIWPFNRPKAIAWLVVEQEGRREIIQEGHPLAAAIIAQSRRRGLEVRMPLMDLEDQMRVQPTTVWGGATWSVVAASRRYDADLVLVGRFRRQADAAYGGRLLAWLGNAEFEGEITSADLPSSGMQAADFLANELAVRYAIPWRPLQRLPLTVNGIASPLHYGGLLSYLESLEFVYGVQVFAVHQDQLELGVGSRAEMFQLVGLLQAGGRLSRSGNDGPFNQLSWRQP